MAFDWHTVNGSHYDYLSYVNCVTFIYHQISVFISIIGITILCFLGLVFIAHEEIMETRDDFQLQNIKHYNCLLFYDLKMFLHSLLIKI